MLQRYNCDFNEETLAHIRHQIRNGMSKFVHRTTNRCAVHEVEVNGKPVRVVWDKLHACVITVLPEG